MSINERVLQLIQELSLSKSAFAQEIAVSPAVISHISSGRNKVGTEVIEKMIAVYPTLSLNWLFTGKGTAFGDESGFNKQEFRLQLTAIRDQARSTQTELNILKKKLEQLDELLQ